jgi:ABC-type taurine transport system ATPase subunit
MPRLALENVTYRAALKDVSLSIEAGEMAMVFAPLKTDRAALLSVAFGIETPDEGNVRRDGYAVFAQRSWADGGGPTVLGQLVLPLLARHSTGSAKATALGALSQWGIEDWSARQLCELEDHELARLSLIRAVACEPEILLVDDPTAGYGVRLADHARRILSVARDRGSAILVAASEIELMTDSDQTYTLSLGAIRGPSTADIIDFPVNA